MARTITTQVFSFSELSPDAQEMAIESYKEELYEGKHGADDFPRWAIDDCSLLEPKHEEMVALFGENYYIDNGNQFVFKNLREGITFNTEHPHRHLSFHKALEITNEKMFLIFLGIPEKFHENISYGFYEENHRYPDTKIEFQMENLELLSGKSEKELEGLISIASEKFDSHRESILERIKDDIDYRYSDESIREDLENNDSIEFTEDGEIH